MIKILNKDQMLPLSTYRRLATDSVRAFCSPDNTAFEVIKTTLAVLVAAPLFYLFTVTAFSL